MRTRGILTAFLFLVPAASFAANKEMQELQRDVALMQEDIRTLQRTVDQQIPALRTLIQQAVDNSSRNSTDVGVLTRTLPDQVKRSVDSSIAPVAAVNTRLDQLGNQVQSLADAIQALNQSMQQIKTQIGDLKNVVQAMQAPQQPPPPTDPGAVTSGTGGPTSGIPPIPADVLYQNALRDRQGGKPDLALAEFRDFIKYYPTSDLAANCQFYIGDIHYSRGEFDQAIKDFDAVLEQYPKGNKTPEAYLYKGLALVKTGRSRDARKEFTAVIQQFPHTDAAQKARSSMQALGFNAPAKGRK